MTRWTPDTCECVIDVIDWDTTQGRTVAACPIHAGLVDNAQMAAVYLGENKPKNLAQGTLRRAAPRLFLTKQGATDTNRARLLALWPRSAEFITAMSDAEVDVQSRDLTSPAAEGQPHLGVKVAYAFASAVGGARPIEYDVPALLPSERSAVEAELQTLGVRLKR